MFRRTLPPLFVIALLAVCASQPVTTATDAKPTVLAQWSGMHSGTNRAATRVVRETAQWEALWRELGREAPQSLDVSREMAVVIFLGERRTGGYRVDPIAVREEEGRLIVDYRERVPPPDAMVAQVLTSPWAVVTLPASPLPVTARKLPSTARAGSDRAP